MRASDFAALSCLALVLALSACSKSTDPTPDRPAGPPVYVAYATSGAGNSVFAYTIDTTTGVFTPVAGSPYTAGSYPIAVAVEPNGKYAYVLNNSSSDITAFAVTASTGALTAIGTYPSGFSYPNKITLDPAGKFLFAKTGSGIKAYKINAATGALSSVGSATPVSGGAFSDIGTATLSSGEYLYATDSIKSIVYAFSVDASTGALASIGSWSTDYNGYNITMPVALAVTPDQKRIYIASSYRSIVVCFDIKASDGTLSQFTPSTYLTGTVPTLAAISADGGALFVTDQNNGLTVFAIDSATGALSGAGSYGVSGTAGDYPFGLAVDPTGGFVYATCKKAGLYAWAIDPSTKALSGVAGSPFNCGTYSYGVTAAKLQP